MAPDIDPMNTQVLATLVANMIQAYLTGTPSPSRTEEVCSETQVTLSHPQKTPPMHPATRSPSEAARASEKPRNSLKIGLS